MVSEILSLFLGFSAVTISLFFRARRTSLFVEMIRPNSFNEVSRAMSVGYLLDLILPLRIGQIMRGIYQAKRLRISLLFSITSIAVERSLDVFVVSLLYFLIVKSNPIAEQLDLEIYVYGSLFISLAIWLFLLAMSSENDKFLAIINKNLEIFNESIRSNLKKSIWATIRNLRNFVLNRKLLRTYFGYFITSWSFLALGLFFFTRIFVLNESEERIENRLGSIFVVTLSTIKSNDFINVLTLGNIFQDTKEIQIYTIFILVQIPVLFILVASLLATRVGIDSDIKNQPTNSHRYGSNSIAASNYIDLYFRRDRVVDSMSKSKVFENMELIEFFKGSSSASTMLIKDGGQLKVRKIVLRSNKEKLKSQYVWLCKNFVQGVTARAYEEIEDDEIWGFDQEYFGGSLKLFNSIHTLPLHQTLEIQRDIFERIPELFYTDKVNLDSDSRHQILSHYINRNLFEKLIAATKESESVAKILDWEDNLEINGELFPPLKSTLSSLKMIIERRQIDLNFSQFTRCHGDLTIDNILIFKKDNSFRLIDPSDDNILKGPTMDIARYLQSIRGGYEFSIANDSPTMLDVQNKNLRIQFLDKRSYQYLALEEEFTKCILPRFRDDVQSEQLDLLTAVLFFRMVSHRIRINAESSLEYMAKGIILLNRYMRNFS